MTRSKLTSVSAAAVLLLYLLFIGSVTSSLFLGTKAQSNLHVLSESSFENRTVPAFIAEKLREHDGGGAVYTGDFGGSSTLIFESSLKGVIYTDVIYGYDGHLYELFCEKDAPFSREDGVPLSTLGDVAFSEPMAGLIQTIVTGSDGKTSVFSIYLMSGGKI